MIPRRLKEYIEQYKDLIVDKKGEEFYDRVIGGDVTRDELSEISLLIVTSRKE